MNNPNIDSLNNGFSHKENSMNNEGSDMYKLYKARSGMQQYTDRIADELVRRFNAPTSREFFLKVAWNLSEDFIWSIEEKSRRTRIKSPLKYFVKVCHVQMLKQNIARQDAKNGVISA